jgi:urease accessory protein UreF
MLLLLAAVARCVQCKLAWRATEQPRVLLITRMWKPQQLVSGEPADWLGDWHPLAEQLGSANGLAALSEVASSLRLAPVRTLDSLRSLLRDHQKLMLLPVELPAIQRAYDHTCRHEVRELVEFDRQLANEPALRPFAEASRRVGQCELQRLRPLRDERIVKRYLEALGRSEAHAWHTLVYGLTLALYSVPLRQGLLGYGFQTSRGFIYAAAPSLRLSERDCRALLEELCEPLPEAVCSRSGRPPEAFLAPVRTLTGFFAGGRYFRAHDQTGENGNRSRTATSHPGTHRFQGGRLQ